MSVVLSLVAAVAASLPVDSIVARMEYQRWCWPQEKIHVVTDRGAYIGGDTVRFRAFLVDASTHRPAEGSEYVYVELRDPFGKVAERVKIKRRDGRFAGMIPLPKEMAEGSYTLSAYTLFMQNQGPDYFFRKPLPVRSYYSLKYTFDTEFTPDGRLRVSLTEGHRRRPVEAESLTLNGPDGVLADAGRKKSAHTFKISDRVRDGGVVSVKFDSYEKFIALPPDSARLHVSFHPEGGYMIPGEMNTVAFKAIDGAGRGVDVSGAVFDSAGHKVVDLHSRHLGMGTVQFIPEPGVQYTARISGHEFPLPAPEASAAVVRVATNKADRLTVSASGAVPDGALLLAHSRGRLLWADTLSAGRPVRFATDVFGDGGTVQFLLSDPQGRILSSRLAFVYPREVADSLVGPGDYAVSVTDPAYAVADTASSIVAQLLLQSELRTHVEDAAYYFRNPDRTVRADLDALLLTQGWERYDLPSVIGGRISEPQLPMEIGGELSGVVKSRWRGKPLDGAEVNVLAPAMEFATSVKTDSQGRFTVTGVDWPDGIAFVFQATGKKGNREHNFEIDRDRFPEQQSLHPRWTFTADDDLDFGPILGYGSDILLKEITVVATKTDEELMSTMFQALGIKSIDEDYFESRAITTYEEALRAFPGIRVENGRVKYAGAKGSRFSNRYEEVEFWVDGVQWTSVFAAAGESTQPDDSKQATSGRHPVLSQQQRHQKMLQKTAMRMTGNMLSEELAMQQFENSQSVLNEFASSYPFSIVEKIEFLRPNAALIVSNTAAMNAGALIITTKKGAKGQNWAENLFLQIQKPLGYQDAPETYRPHYSYSYAQSDSVAPTTIWIPAIDNVMKLPSVKNSIYAINGISDDGYIYSKLLFEKRTD